MTSEPTADARVRKPSTPLITPIAIDCVADRQTSGDDGRQRKRGDDCPQRHRVAQERDRCSADRHRQHDVASREPSCHDDLGRHQEPEGRNRNQPRRSDPVQQPTPESGWSDPPRLQGLVAGARAMPIAFMTDGPMTEAATRPAGTEPSRTPAATG